MPGRTRGVTPDADEPVVHEGTSATAPAGALVSDRVRAGSLDEPGRRSAPVTHALLELDAVLHVEEVDLL